MMFSKRATSVRAVLASLLFLQSIPASLAVKGDSGCRRSVCVSASVEGDVVNYEVTGMIQPVGWIGLGFGTGMLNTHMVIMWQNVDGSTTLSQRYASSYSEPRPEHNPPRVATLVEPKALTRPAKTTTFAFQLPANRSLLASTNPREHLVFAFSPARPEQDPSSSITRHHYTGYFTLDFTKDFTGPDFGQRLSSTKQPSTIAQGTNATYKKIERLIILHGALVSFGFLVLLPAGSLIGRWARSFTPRWFKLHQLSNGVVALPVITFGVVLGPIVVASKESYRIHFANDHEKYGVVLLLLYYAQVLLGRYIHNRRMDLAKLGPITQPHPPLNIFHICLGISIIGLSFFQIRSGMGWWETLTGRGPIASWALPLWKAWAVILPLAYFAGYALLPRQLRLEKEAAYAPLPAVTVDERAQATHLLGEDEEDRQ